VDRIAGWSGLTKQTENWIVFIKISGPSKAELKLLNAVWRNKTVTNNNMTDLRTCQVEATVNHRVLGF
jgi:hypothetical protein